MVKMNAFLIISAAFIAGVVNGQEVSTGVTGGANATTTAICAEGDGLFGHMNVFEPLVLPCPAVGETVYAIFEFTMPTENDTEHTATQVSIAASYDGSVEGVFNETDGLVVESLRSSFQSFCDLVTLDATQVDEDGELGNGLCSGDLRGSLDKLCYGISYNANPGKLVRYGILVGNIGGVNSTCSNNIMLEASLSDIFSEDHDAPSQCVTGLTAGCLTDEELELESSKDYGVCEPVIPGSRILEVPSLLIPCPEVGERVGASFNFSMPDHVNVTNAAVQISIAVSYSTTGTDGVYNETIGLVGFSDEGLENDFCDDGSFLPQTFDDAIGSWYELQVDQWSCDGDLESPGKLCHGISYNREPGYETNYGVLIWNTGGECVGDVLIQATLRPLTDTSSEEGWNETKCLSGLTLINDNQCEDDSDSLMVDEGAASTVPPSGTLPPNSIPKAPELEDMEVLFGETSEAFDLVLQQTQTVVVGVPGDAVPGTISCTAEADNGDLDLYVKVGSRPTITGLGSWAILSEDADCESASDFSFETCEVEVDTPARVYASVFGYDETTSITVSCGPVGSTISRSNPELP